jgi:predicted acetylornithine/succinylornithine family transaminase
VSDFDTSPVENFVVGEHDQDTLVAIGRKTMSKNFRQQPLVAVKGEGMYIWDRAGKRYLDFIGGIAVNGLGHSHPRLIEAGTRQLSQLWHVSNLYFNEPQILLSEQLSKAFGQGRVYLCNSGAEANESALKFARRYGSITKGEPKRTNFITFEKSFHGRTMFALSATAQPKYHKGFEPVVPGFRYAKFNDIDSVKALIDDTVCGVLVEPIQAEGGIIMPEPGFLAELRQLTIEHGALLLLDEVQCGIGRTGTLFAFEQEGIKPDVVTLAKALGGGLPIGAMISSEEVSDAFQPGSHGSTFAGNAVASRIALEVLKVIDEDGLLSHVKKTGKYFMQQLDRLAKKYDFVDGARGRGFIVGLGFNKDYAPEAMMRSMKRGLLVNKLNPCTLRFLPPLIAEHSHIDAAIDILTDVFDDLKRNPPEME